MKKIVVVGGVAGGASAAARLRRLDEDARIIMLERGEHVSFSNCCLPYYLGGSVERSESLVMMTPQAFRERHNIEARVNSEVVAILRDANRIFNMNWFGPVALETAYNQCEDYVEELCAYIDANKHFFNDYIAKNMPQLKVTELEATYLTWVDFRGTGMTTEEIEHFIAHEAHIGVDMGTWFGTGGAGFLRFALACPRCILEKALEQLKTALENHNKK